MLDTVTPPIVKMSVSIHVVLCETINERTMIIQLDKPCQAVYSVNCLLQVSSRYISVA